MIKTDKNPPGVIKSISAGVVSQLESEDIETTRTASGLLGGAARAKARPDQFVFFAAFDGTNNDKDDLKVSGTPQQTNVAQLFDQANREDKTNPNQKKAYYAGVGTSKSIRAFGDSANNPMPATEATAKDAYDDFCIVAKQWLREDRTRSAANVFAAITGFSRGAGTAIVFAKLLNERGLPHDEMAVGFAAPEPVGVVATLLFDPVITGLILDLRLPPNVNDNVVVAKAENEFRDQFKAVDFGPDQRVQSIPFIGNHGNIGGFYDNGIGAMVLQGATDFCRNSGIAMSEVPIGRRFVDKNVFIYSEAIERKFNNPRPKWTEVSDNGVRLTMGADNSLWGRMGGAPTPS